MTKRNQIDPKQIKEDVVYFFGKLNFGASFLDARAVQIMNNNLGIGGMLKEIEAILKIALQEAATSKWFSSAFKKIQYEAHSRFYPFLEEIIGDVDVDIITKNKARYTLAEMIDNKELHGRSGELLLSAAVDGCHDSQDVLFSYASGKKEEAHILSIVAPWVDNRES